MITKSGYEHKHSYKGHRDVINSFVYNEEHLYTASNDGRILQWSIQEDDPKRNAKPRQFGKLLKAYFTEEERKGDFSEHTSEVDTDKLHTQGICCLALNGKYLYSGSFDTTTIKWDTTNTKDPYMGTFKGHTQAVYSVVCLDVWLLTASRDKTVRVWNEATRKQTAILGGGDAQTGHSEPIRAMVVQDRLLYTGSDDKTIRQWEWRAGAMVRVYRGHKDGVTDLKLLEKFLFSSSFDMTVRTWAVESGSCVRICQAEAGLRGLEVAAGKIFGAGNNAVLYIWDLSTNSSEALAADRLARGGLTMVAVEGNKVYCSSSDNACRVWVKSSTPGAGMRREAHASAAPEQEGVGADVEQPVDVLNDESDDEQEEQEEAARRAEAAARDRAAPLGDDALERNRFLDHVEGVHAVCVCRGVLYSGGSDNKVRVRAVEGSGQWGGECDEAGLPVPLERHSDRVLAVTIAGDGEFLFSSAADNSIVKWNAATGAYIDTLAGHTDWVSCLTEFQGNLFSGSWDNSIRKWDVAADKFIAEFLGHQDPVCCLAVVGEVLLSGSRDCSVRAWRVDSGECIKVYEGHNALVSAVIAADPVMYTASWDKTIRCWDLATGNLRRSQVRRLDKPVLCLGLHRGVLYAGGGDRAVHAYAASTMEELQAYAGHAQPVNALAVSQRHLYSAADDGAVIQWTVPEGADTALEDANDPALSVPLAHRIATAPQTGNLRRQGTISNRLNSEAQYLAQVDAEDPVPSRKEGFLYKQGVLFKRWSRRYYTLHKGVLVIYSDNSTTKPLEHIIMHDVLSASRVDNTPSNSKFFPFIVETIDRVRKLAADKSEDAEEWVSALNKYVENNNLQKKIEQKRAARKY